jgi:hypothetical protein
LEAGGLLIFALYKKEKGRPLLEETAPREEETLVEVQEV